MSTTLLKITIQEKKKIILFDYIIANVTNDKKCHSVVTDLFLRSRKLNLSLVFIKQSPFLVPKDVRISTTHSFIMKIPNTIDLH